MTDIFFLVSDPPFRDPWLQLASQSGGARTAPVANGMVTSAFYRGGAAMFRHATYTCRDRRYGTLCCDICKQQQQQQRKLFVIKPASLCAKLASAGP